MAPKADQVEVEVAPVVEEQESQEPTFVETVIDLVIESPDGTFKRVKSVRMNENVSSLRQLLVEDRDLFFHTAFTLQLAHVTKNGKKKAVVNGEVLSDFALLVSFPELLSGTAYVRMVPTPYTCAGVHEHVTQLRKVLHGPPVQYSGMEHITRSDALDILGKIAKASADADAKKPATESEKAADAAKPKEVSKPEETSVSETKETKKIPAFSADEVTDAAVPVPITLSGFYSSESQRKDKYQSFDDAMKGIEYEECIKSISFSQWNPPPRQCALMGDLAYLEVHTLEGSKLQVTATPAGFFVNSTRNGQFNSNPGATPYRALTLVGLLQQASKLFKKRLAAMLTLVDTRAKAFAKQMSLNETDVLQMHNVTTLQTPVDRADMTQWNSQAATVAPDFNNTDKKNNNNKEPAKESVKEPLNVSEWMTPKTAVAHTKNENRAEAFICDSLTLTLSVTLRDWNDEYQSICEMPVLSLDDRIARARALDSLGKEFKEAAVSGAMGVLSGRIPSLDAAETADSRVYLLNNIFFSLATLDEEEKTKNKDEKTPQVISSATSSYSTWNHDLQSVKAMNRVLEQVRRVRESTAADESNTTADAQATSTTSLAALDAALMSSRTGLHTLATVVVDYLGRRVVAQAIIHGILQGDPSSTLLYGSMNKGQSIASAPKAHELMREVAPGLSLKESVVHPLGIDEQAEEGWMAVTKAGEVSPAEKDVSLGKTTEVVTSSPVTSSDPKAEVSLFGPVECKGVQGLDGRVYAIDLVRMMPFDMNYYMPEPSAESETANISVTVPTANSTTYVALLRPELLPLHARSALRQVGESRQTFIREKLGAMLKVNADSSATEEAEAKTTPSSTDVVKKEGEEDTPAATPAGSISAEQAQELSKLAMEAFPDPEPLLVDVNAFSEFKLVGSAEEIKSNEADVLSLCKFLLDVRVPEFVRDLSDSIVTVQDGETLCKAMHSAGINLRYLGKVCELILEAELTTRRVVSRENTEGEEESTTIVIPPVARYLAEICEIEMVGRAVKTLLRGLIKQHSAIAEAPAPVLAALLNYLLGSDATLPLSGEELYPTKQQQANKKGHVEGLAVLTDAMSSLLLRDGPIGLWKQIEEHVKSHFGYSLRMWNRTGTAPAPTATQDPDSKIDSEEMHNYTRRAYPIPFLRRVCQLVGVRVASRDYEMIVENRYPFSPSDVVNVVPVIKTSIPDWPLDEARQFLAAARAHVAAWSPQSQIRPSNIKQPSPSQAFQLANQSVNLVNQVNGICHRSAADGYQVIAAVLEHVGEDAAAITQQLHALVLMDRDGARDTPAVAHAHAWLGRYYQRMGEVASAIDHIRRAIYLLDIICGPSHAESAAMYKLLGELYVTVGTPKHLNLAVASIQEALRRCDYDRVQFGLCLSAMGQAFACGGDFREAIKYSQQANKLLEDALGAKDKRTMTAQAFVKLFTTKAVEYQREMKNKQGGGGVRVVHQQRVQVNDFGAVDVAPQVADVTGVAAEVAVDEQKKAGGGGGGGGKKTKKNKNKSKKNKKK